VAVALVVNQIQQATQAQRILAVVVVQVQTLVRLHLLAVLVVAEL
jgi:hypothetical protein